MEGTRRRTCEHVMDEEGEEWRIDEMSLEQEGDVARYVQERKEKKRRHCGRVTQICVFNTVKLGTSASSP